MVNDPKRDALVRNGFHWVSAVGVWLNEERKQIVSSAAVQQWGLGELLRFIQKRTNDGQFAQGFRRDC